MIAAERLGRRVRCRAPVWLAVGSLLVSACTTATGNTGVATAVTLATANPLLGAGAGVAAQWATGKASDYQEARLREAIAEAGGEASPAETVPWSIGDRLPIGRARGILTVVDDEVAGDCKAVRFTIVEGAEDQVGDYAGTVCPEAHGWQLAEARPLYKDQWTPPEEEASSSPAKRWIPPETAASDQHTSPDETDDRKLRTAGRPVP